MKARPTPTTGDPCTSLFKAVYRELTEYNSRLHTWSDVFVADTLLALGDPFPDPGVVDTMATDGNGIAYNPDWLLRLIGAGEKAALRKVKFCLVHEVMHVVMCHHLEFKAFKPRDQRRMLLMNVACDLAINSMLDNGMLPKDALVPCKGLFKSLPKGKDCRWYYNELVATLPSLAMSNAGNPNVGHSGDQQHRESGGGKGHSSQGDSPQAGAERSGKGDAGQERNRDCADDPSGSPKRVASSDGGGSETRTSRAGKTGTSDPGAKAEAGKDEQGGGLLDQIEQQEVNAIPENVFAELSSLLPEGGVIRDDFGRFNPNGFNTPGAVRKQLETLFAKKAHTIRGQYYHLSMGPKKVVDANGYPQSLKPDSTSTFGAVFNLRDLAVAGEPKITGQSCLPWYSLVAPFIRPFDNEFTRMRPNFKQMGAYQEGFGCVPIGRRGLQVAEIIFLVDVSGSMKSGFIDIFNAFAVLLNRFEIVIRVLFFAVGLIDEYIFTTLSIPVVKKSSGVFFKGRIPDDRVFRVRDFAQVFAKGFPNVKGRGGTALAPALARVYEARRKISRLFIYTDAELKAEDYGQVQELHRSRPNKTVWLVTRSGADFGHYVNRDVLRDEIVYDTTNNGRGFKDKGRRGRLSV